MFLGKEEEKCAQMFSWSSRLCDLLLDWGVVTAEQQLPCQMFASPLHAFFFSIGMKFT